MTKNDFLKTKEGLEHLIAMSNEELGNISAIECIDIVKEGFTVFDD